MGRKKNSIRAVRYTARALLGAVLAVVTACADAPDDPGAANNGTGDTLSSLPADEVVGGQPPAGVPPRDTPGGTPQRPNGSGGPPEPYVDRGVCPFECCLYREWETVAAVPVFSTERDTTTVAFTLPAGQRFTAVTGNVHLDRVGVAVVSDSVTIGYGPENETALVPGDTVYVLSHRGEGEFNLWHEGRLFVGEGFWAMMPLSGGGPAGRLVREPESEWWVQVRDASGREGWIDMNRNGEGVRGADACG